MAKTVDQLVLEIRAETKGLRRGLEETNRRIDQTGKSAKRALVPLGGFTRLFAAIGAGAALRGITNTSRQFEDLEATLRAVTGSQENAALAFKTVEDFTKTTPFQLANVTESFIRFYQAGITPSNENLTAFGNLAAGMGKDITQLAQATFNATTGEMEMLKQFGIKAKLMGDEIEVTFEGQTKTIARTGEAIGEFLLDLGRTRFPTALEERLNTLSGALSNLADNSSIFMNEIGEAGLNKALTRLAKTLEEVVVASGGLATAIGTTLGGAFDLLSGFIGGANKFFLELFYRINQANIGIKEFGVSFSQMMKSTQEFFGLDTRNNQEAILTELEEIARLRGENLKILDNLILLEKRREELKAGKTPTETGGEGTIEPPKGDTKNEINELSKAFGELDTVVKEAGQSLSRDFADDLLEGESALESFKNFTKAIVSEIIATFLNLAIVQPLISSIFSGFSFSGAPSPTPNLSPVEGGASVRTAASGGNASFGNAMLVGERGPELFVPHAPGTIMNSADTRSNMGGGGIVVNQNISFATGVVPTVRAEVTKMLPQIADVSKAAVLDASMRGGSFSKGIRGRNG
jgi:hypothetical protein